MDRNVATISLEVPKDMKKEILKAVRELHFHSKSELVRTGIRRILDEVKETSRGANWK